MPLSQLTESPILFVLWIGAVIFALTIHEFSHAFAGYLQGDHTAEDEGRLTLNPLSHIDWVGFLLLVLKNQKEEFMEKKNRISNR